MPMNLRVIVNSNAGKTVAGPAHPGKDELLSLIRELGMEGEVTLVESEALERTLVQAREGKWDVVAVGGGDGTIGTAARIFAGSPIPLAILPMGTFNYFARFLHLPLEVVDVVRTLPGSTVESFDMVEVNGRLFLSHSAIGIFPRYIMERLLLQRRRHLSKIPAMIGGLLKTFIRHQVLVITVSIQGRSKAIPTPSLVVGNNAGVLSPLFARDEERSSLMDGRFSLFIGRRLSRWTSAWSSIESFFGKVDIPSDYERMDIEQCTVDAPRKSLLVTVDGELVILQTPLSYRIRPGLLRLLVPPE
jgi:diacylglycerol kinase family enzyme